MRWGLLADIKMTNEQSVFSLWTSKYPFSCEILSSAPPDVCPTSLVYCQLDYSGEWYGNQYHIFSEEISKSFKMEIILKFSSVLRTTCSGRKLAKALRYFSENLMKLLESCNSHLARRETGRDQILSVLFFSPPISALKFSRLRRYSSFLFKV